MYDSNPTHVEGSSKIDDSVDALAAGVASSVSLKETVSTASGSSTTTTAASTVVTAGSATQPVAKAKRPIVSAQTSEKDVSSFFQSLLSSKK